MRWRYLRWDRKIHVVVHSASVLVVVRCSGHIRFAEATSVRPTIAQARQHEMAQLETDSRT